MPRFPHSPSQKRFARRFSVVIAVGVACSVTLADTVGTYTAFSIPTVIETIGFLLVFGLWNAIAFAVAIRPNTEELIIDNPFAGVPLTILYLVTTAVLLAIDATLFAFQGFTILTTTAAANQALISLIFSGLLVLLYYDQHRTQRQQVQLMQQQTELAERRASWRETQERPRLRVGECQFYEGDDSLTTTADTDIAVDSIVSYLTDGFAGNRLGLLAGQLSNRGGTTARSLHLRMEVLVRSDDLPNGYLHLNGSFLFIRTNLVNLERDIQDQYLNRETISIPKDETANVLGAFAVYATGKTETSMDTLGELIHRLPFTVEDVVLRTSFRYEGPTGTEHTEPVAAVRLPADELDSLAAAFTSERRVGFHGVPTVGNRASQEFFEEEFADVTPFRGGVAIDYNLEG